MFGDLFGQMEEQQKELREKLKEITIEAEAGDGAVKVSANAAREIINIKVDPSVVDLDDLEQMEDLLLVAINRALEKAAVKEAAESQKLISGMLPPGMAGLFGG
ncbi:MAG: YbaB/EbfC family nucleoid-associated protein [Saprospiraceae bacterium]|nr:YbaB/EbfC family nucleoid-associated protein [Lewinella sp.]